MRSNRKRSPTLGSEIRDRKSKHAWKQNDKKEQYCTEVLDQAEFGGILIFAAAEYFEVLIGSQPKTRANRRQSVACLWRLTSRGKTRYL